MVKNFKFTVVLSTFSNYKVSIESLISQNLDFEDNIQIILINENNQKNNEYLEYINRYPDNFIILDNENGLNSRNLSLDYIQGSFVNFMQAGDEFDKDTLSIVLNFFDNNSNVDLVSIPLFDDVYNRLYYETDFNEGIVDLKNINNQKFSYFYTPIFSSFIKSDYLSKYAFESLNVDNGGMSVICKFLIDTQSFALIKNTFCHHNKDNEFKEDISEEIVFKKLNFLNILINYSLENLGCVPTFVQHILVKELESIVKIEDIDLISSNPDKISEFWKLFNELLSNIEIDSIKSNNFVDNSIKSFLIFKINNSFCIDFGNNKLLFKSNDYAMNKIHNHKLNFDVIEIRKNTLNLSGSITSLCYNKNLMVKAILTKSNGDIESYIGKFVEYPTTNRKTVKYLSHPWVFSYNFDFKIPINQNEVSRISFRTIYEDEKDFMVLNNIVFPRKYSHLSKFSHYLVKDKIMVLFKNNSFYCMPFNLKNKFKFDLRAIFEIFKEKPPYYLNGMFMRFLIMILYPFWRNKKIWIFMDRLDAADDNAEHLFKYAMNQKDDITKYYVLDKSAKDFKRLSKNYKNVLSFGSFKHKILFLFTQKVVSSQPAVSLYNPFFNENIILFAGFYPDVYFLQHGVTKDNISSWLHKFNRNLALISTTSDLEKESFLDEGYNYDEEIIQTLGFTRYDNLNNKNTKKQIVIMPSWRNYIKNEDDLLNSEYFQRWNSLINNSDLINYAKDKNYEIVFKPHLNLYKFIDLFDTNDYVIIDHVKKYQEIFNESALLITDYSSIFFDFSYIKKPLIYYQYANDYHFDSENGYFNYKKMGFGEVIDNEENLIDKIKFYLDSDCVMEDIYKTRVDNFFKHTDKNNCKRTYEWIYKN